MLASACAIVCGKYLQLPASATHQITGSLTLTALARNLFSKLHSGGRASEMLAPATVDGHRVLQLAAKGGIIVDVAATGPPYPLRIKDAAGNIWFSQWNAVRRPHAPPASSVIRMSQLIQAVG